MSKKKSFLLSNLIFAALFIVFIAIDRITKQWAIETVQKGEIELISDALSFYYLENRGAAWGMLQNATWLFIISTVIILAIMVYFYGKIPCERKYHLLRFSLLLLAAGAIGNFVDRIMWHYVVDFIYVKLISFPIFNVADCYVCISAALLIYCLLFKYKEEEFLWKNKSSK